GFIDEDNARPCHSQHRRKGAHMKPTGTQFSDQPLTTSFNLKLEGIPEDPSTIPDFFEL
ncbi:hypothetical protein J6590_036648, partial [Homalodisca vitripennis]